MADKQPYIVLTERGEEILAQRVSEMILDGYSIHGSMVVKMDKTISFNSAKTEHTYLHMQPMILNKYRS